jgi:hypothetical protein
MIACRSSNAQARIRSSELFDKPAAGERMAVALFHFRQYPFPVDIRRTRRPELHSFRPGVFPLG